MSVVSGGRSSRRGRVVDAVSMGRLKQTESGEGRGGESEEEEVEEEEEEEEEGVKKLVSDSQIEASVD